MINVKYCDIIGKRKRRIFAVFSYPEICPKFLREIFGGVLVRLLQDDAVLVILSRTVQKLFDLFVDLLLRILLFCKKYPCNNESDSA